jgi:adenylate cyclase
VNLLAELKRRNVIRMAGLYLVGAWLAVQVAATLLPVFEAPAWVMKALVVLLAIGFLAALVFAWVFELTPEGLKRDGEVPVAESIAPQTARRLDRGIIVVLLLALGFFAFDRFVLAPQREAVLVANAAKSAQAIPASPPPAPAATPPVSQQASIAVLAFANMSTDAENGYFADGISEELLNVLADVDGLKVASRTSAFSFKGKDTPIPEIARQLGVAYVLEGSVRRQDQRVRITAQLIHAGGDEHVWTESYDRELTDIFQVQEEIARAITGELEGILGKRQVSVTASTGNMEAYQAFLRGRARFNRRDELLEAIQDLSLAVTQDPQFAEAWTYLAATWFVAPGYHVDAEVEAVHAKGQMHSALQRAAALAPEHPMVLALEGQWRALDADQIGALALLERASALSVQDSNPMMWRGMLLLQTGYVDEAIAVLEQARNMDPLAGINNGYLAIAYLSAGRNAQAEATARRAEALGWDPAIFVFAYDLAVRGKREQALAIWDEFIPVPGSEVEAQRFAAIRRLLVDASDADARATLRKLPLEGAIEYLIMSRDYDTLLEMTEQQFAQRAVYRRQSFWMRMAWLPSTRELRESPRFLAYAESAGIARLWQTRGWPDGCVRVQAASGGHLNCSGMPE